LSGGSLYFYTVSGSFYEALGGYSHGLEVDLGRLWEEAYKEQPVSELPTRVVCLWGRFLKL